MSTQWIGESIDGKFAVFYPLMPKGVEHITLIGTEKQIAWVFYPLMPKGVEHQTRTFSHTGWDGVFYPLMPKGVEH